MPWKWFRRPKGKLVTVVRYCGLGIRPLAHAVTCAPRVSIRENARSTSSRTGGAVELGACARTSQGAAASITIGTSRLIRPKNTDFLLKNPASNLNAKSGGVEAQARQALQKGNFRYI